ncbi:MULTISPECIES: hypothetical protein [unclassified Leptolyngbya]|uniref:hypothetical protein n=1 Tax=unclassified Leptolyngbya TaxID=2650499 RepID=UPI0016836A3F|nr:MULTISPECIES: hypothetical protein [unclassified Leptolyngbya]MBD1912982.1 hypothetical protein [Leptolyngbya sp. FACHB-8]MBD2155707.1 hypothetical protein [Leptolyngbya sp. FACHB-16]
MQSPFDAAVDALSQHECLTRIKKLLIYTCQSVWESDPYRLDYFDLRSLVYQLLQLAPSREQLRSRLDTFVRTLSKVDEYTHVADIIYSQLEPLCVHQPSGPLKGDSRWQSKADRQRYRTVARQLLQDPEQVRIKKILYCAQTRTWENDPGVLSQIDLEALLQDLHSLLQTPEALALNLNAIVQTLNRQEQYIPIAQRTQRILAPLFAEEAPEQTRVMPAASPQTVAPAPSKAQRSPAPPPPPPPPRATAISPPAPSFKPAVKVLDTANLMDVRLQVMKYSNPLRAKVLLFSTLYRPLGPEPRSWEVLHSHELDTLLLEAFRAFRDDSELRLKLQQTAEALAESEHYIQAAGAILRALKPYYAPKTSSATSPEEPVSAGGPNTSISKQQEWTVPHLPPHPKNSP